MGGSSNHFALNPVPLQSEQHLEPCEFKEHTSPTIFFTLWVCLESQFESGFGNETSNPYILFG